MLGAEKSICAVRRNSLRAMQRKSNSVNIHTGTGKRKGILSPYPVRRLGIGRVLRSLAEQAGDQGRGARADAACRKHGILDLQNRCRGRKKTIVGSGLATRAFACPCSTDDGSVEHDEILCSLCNARAMHACATERAVIKTCVAT